MPNKNTLKKEDKKQRADLIETLLKAINILRDGNDINFALEFIKRHTKETNLERLK